MSRAAGGRVGKGRGWGWGRGKRGWGLRARSAGLPIVPVYGWLGGWLEAGYLGALRRAKPGPCAVCHQ